VDPSGSTRGTYGSSARCSMALLVIDRMRVMTMLDPSTKTACPSARHVSVRRSHSIIFSAPLFFVMGGPLCVRMLAFVEILPMTGGVAPAGRYSTERPSSDGNAARELATAWSSGSVWLICIFDGHGTFRSRRVLSVHSRLMTGCPSLHALFHLSTHPWKRRFVRGLPLLSVYVSGSKSTAAIPSTCAPATAAVTVPRKNSTATLRTVRGSMGQSTRRIVMLRVSPVRGPFCDHVNS